MEGQVQNKTVLGPGQLVSGNSSSGACSSLLPHCYQAHYSSTPTNHGLDCIKVRLGSKSWAPRGRGRSTSSFGVYSGGWEEHCHGEAVGRARKFQWPPTWDNHSVTHSFMCECY